MCAHQAVTGSCKPSQPWAPGMALTAAHMLLMAQLLGVQPGQQVEEYQAEQHQKGLNKCEVQWLLFLPSQYAIGHDTVVPSISSSQVATSTLSGAVIKLMVGRTPGFGLQFLAVVLSFAGSMNKTSCAKAVVACSIARLGPAPAAPWLLDTRRSSSTGCAPRCLEAVLA